MKKVAVLSVLSVVALLVIALPQEASAWHGGWHGRVVIGGPVWWGPPYWYYAPPYAYAPPPVVVEQPPVYVERPAPPAPPAAATAFWYYCASAKGYYPTVPSCPEEWVKVPERSQ